MMNYGDILLRFVKKKKIDFIPMYGATEATSRMSFLEKKFLNSKIGCIGKGLDNTKMYLGKSIILL